MKPHQLNRADQALNENRKLQALIYDRNASPVQMFEQSKKIIPLAKQSEKDIRKNYAEISAKLTKQMNTGVVQKDLEVFISEEDLVGSNSATIALKNIIEFQDIVFSRKKTLDQIFGKTQEISNQLENASKEFKIDYESISNKMLK